MNTCRLLIVDPDRGRAERVTAAFGDVGRIGIVADAASARVDDIAGGAVTGRIDVVVVALEASPPSGLASAHALLSRDPCLEAVLFARDLQSPECQAAHTLGIQRVIPQDRVGEWLREVLPTIERAVHARREIAACAPLLAHLTTRAGSDRGNDDVASGRHVVPLYEAERRFRETYLVRLLSQTRSQGEAAQRAGLPYRTLNHMLSKLGIQFDRRANGQH